MRKVFPLLLAGATLAALTFPSFAQKEKKPETWEEKAAARLKPVTDQQKKDIEKAVPAKPTAEPEKDRRILVFWRCEGFIHTSIPCGNFAIEQLGTKTGAFSADLSDDYSVFTSENLAQYDAVLFNNTTHLKFPDEKSKKALMDFVTSGKGVIGFHAATDNFKRWEEVSEMMGGSFDGHPWTAGGKWAFKLDDPEHPINAAFNGTGFWHTDEIYQNGPNPYSREKLRVLVSLDMSKPQNNYSKFRKMLQEDKIKRKDNDYAVSWLREFNGGRVFYSNFGHREDTFWNPMILQHYLDGIQYALGDLEADATPSAKMKDLVAVSAPDEEA
ncbi:MAG: ThuA domain-containing protein [Verrucomicrobiota bacterium]